MRHRRCAPGRPVLRPRDVPDPAPRQIAAVQAAASDWLVMWSAWRRDWTAFARFGPVALVVDDPDPGRLLRRCRAAELTFGERRGAGALPDHA